MIPHDRHTNRTFLMASPLPFLSFILRCPQWCSFAVQSNGKARLSDDPDKNCSTPPKTENAKYTPLSRPVSLSGTLAINSCHPRSVSSAIARKKLQRYQPLDKNAPPRNNASPQDKNDIAAVEDRGSGAANYADRNILSRSYTDMTRIIAYRTLKRAFLFLGIHRSGSISARCRLRRGGS